MKKIILLFSVTLLIASCQKQDEALVPYEGTWRGEAVNEFFIITKYKFEITQKGKSTYIRDAIFDTEIRGKVELSGSTLFIGKESFPIDQAPTITASGDVEMIINDILLLKQ